MDTEIIARVDAWLAARGERATSKIERLEVLWRELASGRRLMRHAEAIEVYGDAMAGIVLALVREAWGKAPVPESGRGRPGYDARRIYAEPHGDDWIVCWPNGQRLGSARTGSSEAEALVAALEAAP